MKLLLIWELGRGHGHQFQLEWLAGGLQQRNHQVKIIGPELSGYRQFLQPTGNGPAHKCWADLLLLNGFSDQAFINSRLNFWQHLFTQEKPDAIVVDHAPYAHLTAYALNIPCMEFGSAFTLPVPSEPVGRFDDSPPPYNEAALLKNIATSFSANNWPALERLADVYRYSAIRCATGIPLLDHYGPRTEIAYTGAFAAGQGDDIDWGPDSQGKLKLFIYWREGLGLPGFLRQLNPANLVIRAYVPGSGLKLPEKPGWKISQRPWNLNSFSAENLPDIALGYASNAFIQWMAHLGVPQLMAPVYREGLLQGSRAQQLGLGLMCSHSRAEDIADKFTQLVSNPGYPSHAQKFSHYSRENWDAIPRLPALCQLMEARLSR
ncbi:MAG TPA: hypothetical protein VFM46_06860 [Pseudomonadales bacterium]|nr:hypothetical protein [Pseudomonadales bacterium]